MDGVSRPPRRAELSDAPRGAGGRFYFFTHLLAAVCHVPPAFSQSAFVVYCDKSPGAPDGLAAGDDELPDVLPDVLGVVELPVLDPVPEPLVPDVPDGVDAPELPVPPVLDCAAAMAGARATRATKKPRRSVFILTSFGKTAEQ